MDTDDEILYKFDKFLIYLGKSKDYYLASNRAAFMQCFVAGNYNWLLKQIKEGDIVIDAGANIGMFSLQASNLVGQNGKVIAIEPNLKNIEILKAWHKNTDNYANLVSGTQDSLGYLDCKG